MTPRPRKKGNAGLPPNLYANKTGGRVYYSYRHPITKKLHGMGRDKVKAIAAAKQLNSMLVNNDGLVAEVMGVVTLGEHIKWFKKHILPQREYAVNTLAIYEIKFKQLQSELGKDTPVEQISVRDMAKALASYGGRSAQQLRQVAGDLFRAAIGEGIIETNPAEAATKPIAKKQRQRLTLEQYNLIHEIAPLWFQNAMDLAFITLQRREDVAIMKFEQIKDGSLYVIQQKTKKHDTGYLKIAIGPRLTKVIARCRDNIASPFLVHREPERRIRREGMHWTQVRPEMLTREFKSLADKLGIKNTSFHEIRALGVKWYKDQGEKPQELAGHASEKMTKNYDSGHSEIRWIEAKTL